MDEPSMRIGEVARRAGVRVSRIRYYEDIGLLPPAERVAGQRRYDESVLRRLSVIAVGQRAGLSLDEIRELLAPHDDPLSVPLRELARQRLPEIDGLIRDARRVRRWYEQAADCRCRSIDECALFDEPSLPVARRAVPAPSAIRSPARRRTPRR
jgi:MerR family redox-sensitive transcriptional activator SoxR